MCGITGYVGTRSALPIALENLKRLEYRGYDSAGVAYPNCAEIAVIRAVGRIANLEPAAIEAPLDATVAIAHTRWATHGRPSEANAHPHKDCSGRIAVVHNGIIENYLQLREQLTADGHEFTSETDTEVLAHLIEKEYRSCHKDHAHRATQARAGRSSRGIPQAVRSLEQAIRSALQQVTGSYALAVLCQDAPSVIVAARKESPLVVGIGNGEFFLASDIPAVMRHTRRVVLLEDGDLATISADALRLTDREGSIVRRAPIDVTWDDEAAEKAGHAHFMIKEIHENARTVRDTLRGRLDETGVVTLRDLPLRASDWTRFQRIVIVGCGTAFHAGVVGKRLFEDMLRRPVDVCVASEFRYSDPLVGQDTLVVLVSQSGETADTLAAMREAQARGAVTLAIVNVVGSTLARDADAALITQAGPEIGVASTKAYLAQLVALCLLVIHAGRACRVDIAPEFIRELKRVPDLVQTCLDREADVRRLARSLARHRCFFYLGRGYDYAAAMEAALKLKEISYIHAEAFPAGEMKHGPLALVEPGVAVVGLCTQPATHDKMVSNLKEVKAREGTVIAVVRDGDPAPDCADAVITVPATHPALMPVVVMAPLQLLAYHAALELGCEIDQPRNLAKSVTVE